ncbi:type II toxin-antitoxin system VapC family toxin [Sphingomonas sp. SUN039]|uniref:type II toxin-antitoxin system VapC family toxin n=1 Tax=Sphingomonas sp. SUN039 TaxID=2937787 RepID=UPI00216411A6|nr:type II toxin-antitoxin system VapC family toxin [Sphingomonas sp. SUN039]UVO55630.1 type II toxin-antitoxin system VapC family toxin [Sphingomonas sp. SUN039]
MKLLLDTHALLWALGNNPRLSARARAAIADDANEKIVSAVSAFEITTKYRLGKLSEAAPLIPDFEAALAPFDFTFLSITPAHAARAGGLPFAHGDPFDRLLIAQAQVERVTLVSNEKLFDGFGVERVW